MVVATGDGDCDSYLNDGQIANCVALPMESGAT
jgi:hypothetical protein